MSQGAFFLEKETEIVVLLVIGVADGLRRFLVTVLVGTHCKLSYSVAPLDSDHHTCAEKWPSRRVS